MKLLILAAIASGLVWLARPHAEQLYKQFNLMLDYPLLGPGGPGGRFAYRSRWAERRIARQGGIR